jgi:hypothetical protein
MKTTSFPKKSSLEKVNRFLELCVLQMIGMSHPLNQSISLENLNFYIQNEYDIVSSETRCLLLFLEAKNQYSELKPETLRKVHELLSSLFRGDRMLSPAVLVPRNGA